MERRSFSCFPQPHSDLTAITSAIKKTPRDCTPSWATLVGFGERNCTAMSGKKGRRILLGIRGIAADILLVMVPAISFLTIVQHSL
jgi:hypothetical protein